MESRLAGRHVGYTAGPGARPERLAGCDPFPVVLRGVLNVVHLSWFGVGSVCLGVAVGLAVSVSPLSVSQGADPAHGPRIVFLGDSITEAGAGPHGYVTLARQAARRGHARRAPEVIGAGISGNRVPDLLARLDRDVLARKPDVVVIYIGINDVWHSQNGGGTPKGSSRRGSGRSLTRSAASGRRPCSAPRR